MSDYITRLDRTHAHCHRCGLVAHVEGWQCPRHVLRCQPPTPGPRRVVALALALLAGLGAAVLWPSQLR